MAFGAGAVSDPFYLYPPQLSIAGTTRNNIVTGLTEVSPKLVAGESTAVIVTVGQSVTANNVNATYTVTQTKNHMFNFQTGGCYRTVEPLLGCNITGVGLTGNWAAEMADRLIAAGTYTRVILCAMAIGGTTVGDWTNSTSAPFLYNSIGVMGRRLSAAGLAATHIVLGLGESDNLAGTTQTPYATGQSGIIAGFRAAGMACPFIVLRETMVAGATSSAIRAAQSAASGTNVFVGYDMDTNVPDSGGNRQDGTHLTATGRALVAAGVQADITAHP